MKGSILLLVCLITLSNSILAADAAPTTSVAHAAAQAESKQIASANAPKAANTAIAATDTKPAAAAAPSGYFEVVGGFGTAQMNAGKSHLGVSTTETDWVSQTSTNWQNPFAHLGIGYVYFISEAQKGYSEKLIWLPSVEPMLNVYYFNLNANGNVYRFNGPLSTSTFTLPVRSTNLMLDALVTLATYHRLSFFVLGGVGVAWTSVKYKDTPLPNTPAARAPLHLNTSTQSHAAYEWGAGITYAFNPRIALGLEYLYTHIGNARTSGSGTLGGVPDLNITPAGFSLRTQAIFLDLHVALS